MPASPAVDNAAPAPHWPSGFMVVHGNRLEDLRQLLVEHVRRHPLPGLQAEWVVVQSNGMKEWVEQGLAEATGLGVCAATQMVFPAEFLWKMYRAVLGPDRVRVSMPLDRDNLVWRLMRMLPELFSTSTSNDYDALARYAADRPGSATGTRLLQLCNQLAGLYDAYQNYRADWLRLWADGACQWTTAAGLASPLPEAERWQALLWQALCQDVTQQDGHRELVVLPSRAEVHQAFVREFSSCPTAIELPKRVLVFGISAMPMQVIEALATLGQKMQVMVFVLNPCQHHWGHLVSERTVLLAAQRQRQLAKTGAALRVGDGGSDWQHTETQPLLAAWGQQGRDYLHLLDIYDDPAQYSHLLHRIDYFSEPALAPSGQPVSRLQRLQSDILNLNPVPLQPDLAKSDDDSFVLVQAHSAMREVELLHDRVLQWLEQDPSLQARDVIVMVPDMTHFVAQIHAVWGRFGPDDPRRIPYSVADQGITDHPMARILEALLQGSAARLTLDDWLSWMEVSAFAAACDFPADELTSVRKTLQQVGVRWGLDGRHRVQSGMNLPVEQATPNTWLFGLRRLLLAQAQGPLSQQSWHEVWPAEGKIAPSPQALAALCRSLQTLQQVLQSLQQARPARAWVRDMNVLLKQVFRARTEADERTLMALAQPLEKWLEACQLAGFDADLELAVVRTHWLDSLSERGAANRFLTGGVQFATLLPMRSIPFRRVCLLGMNDGKYPRRQPLSDFDLMRQPGQYRPGDRSRREDDRYLFLEALLCAREKVYISWQGWQMHDHSPLYPSVLVGQLLDHLNAVHAPPLQVAKAPMQAFSKRYFEHATGGWKTYASDWASALDRAEHSAAAPKGPLVAPAAPAAPAAPGQVCPERLNMADLIGLLRQPLDVFYSQRLRFDLRVWQEPDHDAEPFNFAPQDLYRLVGEAMIRPEVYLEKARGSGLLPLMGPLAESSLSRLQSQVDVLQRRLKPLLDGGNWHPMPATVLTWRDPETATGLQSPEVFGSLGGLHAESQWWQAAAEHRVMQCVMQPGALFDKKLPRLHRLLSAWVGHLLANACGLPCSTHILGLKETLLLEPLASEVAGLKLHSLLHSHATAWQQPLVVPGKTACVWAASWFEQSEATEVETRALNARQKCRSVFEGSRFSRIEGEQSSLPMLRCHASGFEELLPDIEKWAKILYGDLAQTVLRLNHD